MFEKTALNFLFKFLNIYKYLIQNITLLNVASFLS